MNKWFTLCLYFLLIVLLCGCTSAQDFDLAADFCEFHFGETSETLHGSCITSENRPYISCMSIEMENKYINPRVVMSLYMWDEDREQYNWLKLAPEERKNELKHYGDMLIQYAKANNWDNDYYLYITLSYGSRNDYHITYDYESDTLYIPENESILISMYENFGSFDFEDLKETPAGIDFLLDNDLAYYKHGEVEAKSGYSSYGVKVYIHEGEFSIYDLRDSIMY